MIDTVPHNVSDGQKKRLVEIGKSLMTRLELKRLSGRWEALTGESAFFSMNESQMLAIEGRDKKIQEIKRGLAQDEFVNFYQPKVDLKTYMVNGAETLLRWNHPTRGILAPWEFIPLMEETGLIVEAGRNALLQSMRDWRRWKDEGLKPPQIAVNVAAGQFAGGKLLADVGEALSIAKGLMGEKPLGIEITESGLIENKEAISDQLREIRKLGVTVALDDFGTGYSSLSYLTQLPIDLIKIDRSFIQRLSDSPAHMTLVSAIIGMAHGLRLEVVAEGVETAEECKLLRLLRCPEAQGFLFGKPMSGEKFAELLQSNAPLLGD